MIGLLKLLVLFTLIWTALYSLIVIVYLTLFLAKCLIDYIDDQLNIGDKK